MAIPDPINPRMKLRAPKGEGALTIDELDGCTAGLVALAGRAVLDVRRHGVGGLLDRLVGMFGRNNVYVELPRHFRRDEEREREHQGRIHARHGSLRQGRVPRITTDASRRFHCTMVSIVAPTMVQADTLVQ